MERNICMSTQSNLVHNDSDGNPGPLDCVSGTLLTIGRVTHQCIGALRPGYVKNRWICRHKNKVSGMGLSKFTFHSLKRTYVYIYRRPNVFYIRAAVLGDLDRTHTMYQLSW